MKKSSLFFMYCLIAKFAFTQEMTKDSSVIIKNKLDSLFISETEAVKGKDKVLHAEPLFIDLIRDLGARKGEKEWNIGFGMTDKKTFDSYSTLVEYEFAPINRLGLELELPFTFYYKTDSILSRSELPVSKLNSVKMAAQYSFYVSEKRRTSLAVGYIHEFELNPFNKYKAEGMYKGNIYNPFFVAAKRWNNNFHTLLYTGLVIEKHLNQTAYETIWQINSNFHYMISGTRNFIGMEINKEVNKKDFDMVLRPQMRVGIADNLLVGIVSGIPIKRETQRFSSFIRIIYEPKHHSSTKNNSKNLLAKNN